MMQQFGQLRIGNYWSSSTDPDLGGKTLTLGQKPKGPYYSQWSPSGDVSVCHVMDEAIFLGFLFF